MPDETQVFNEIAKGDIKSRLKKTQTVEKSHLPTKDELKEAKKDPAQKVEAAPGGAAKPPK
ncbi:hypothetical protein HK104_011248 [Borealophlyctis nickersoniae]|nr:hypothetical protein HK104_011248 [Borealophlyctis nickersoniae]